VAALHEDNAAADIPARKLNATLWGADALDCNPAIVSMVPVPDVMILKAEEEDVKTLQKPLRHANNRIALDYSRPLLSV
jgi:hypothetical protein